MKTNQTKYKNMRTISILIGILVMLSACGQNGVVHMTSEEFSKIIETEGVLIDVRTSREFQSGHIAGATNISTSDPELKTKLAKYKKDESIFVYCYSGARSRNVANYLASQGYTKIYNLQRGTMEWQQKGNKLVTDGATAQAPQENAMTIAQFNELIKSDIPVFIDFYAPWCGPCKMMAPMIEELKTEYSGKIKVVKINTDASQDLTKHLRITGIPYMVLYKNSTAVYTKQGLGTKEELKQNFEANL